MSDLLSRAEVAQRAGISVVWVDKLIATGALKSVKIGRLRRVPADAVDRFIAANAVRTRRAGDAKERRVAELVAQPPPLTDEQKSRLRSLLNPASDRPLTLAQPIKTK